ncbi:GSCFA domain-containing protein [Coprobacter tertius]|uniref:GSCFA domain-containing protein n=1 Tax=Coprobacter tertius TaxID=2944915 RepID=A0ABT1MIW1_9BACT|nr:GSCFA domain-containing protein [Coprobacter tertius]MCP9612560.1 GSCFA domain-containing protein [Coprobacter tertius]
MDFSTVIPLSRSIVPVTYHQQLLLFGSCFTEHIGERLLLSKFNADVNPFGIQYNPLSIERALTIMLDTKVFTPDDLFQDGRLWHSRMHHSLFSHTDKNECLHRINERIIKASDELKTSAWLMVTWGSSYVYRLKSTGEVVSNCHKQPASDFVRERVTPSEIVERWSSLINRLISRNSGLKILFTVSPVRHLKDGMHENQLSKAVLLLAADELCRSYPGVCFYFPSYEIMNDELRDYRFYNEDMIHPSPVAVSYIWERFTDVFFNEETRAVYDEWSKLSRSLRHRPLTPDKIAYKDFVMQNLLKLERFSEKYPYFALSNEIHLIEDLLKTL